MRDNIEVPLIDDGMDGTIAGPDTSKIQYFIPGTAPAYTCIRCPEVSTLEHCLVNFLNANSRMGKPDKSQTTLAPLNPCKKCVQGQKNRERYAAGEFSCHFGLKKRNQKV